MGKEPDDIRNEIGRTDVPSRARDSMGEAVQPSGDAVREGAASLKDKVLGAAGGVQGAVQGAVANTRAQAAQGVGAAFDATRSASQETVRRSLDNPMGLALGAAAMGFLAGLLLPVTDIERERVSPIAGDLKERAMETVREQGQTVANSLLSGGNSSGG